MDQMMEMAMHPAMNQASGVLTGAIGLSQASILNSNVFPTQKISESVYRPDTLSTVITRYEKAENGWVVYVAQHEGERFKRYIAATLEEAHKQVSAYIAAERLDR